MVFIYLISIRSVMVKVTHSHSFVPQKISSVVAILHFHWIPPTTGKLILIIGVLFSRLHIATILCLAKSHWNQISHQMQCKVDGYNHRHGFIPRRVIIWTKKWSIQGSTSGEKHILVIEDWFIGVWQFLCRQDEWQFRNREKMQICQKHCPEKELGVLPSV
jgi:hypothetical protein